MLTAPVPRVFLVELADFDENFMTGRIFFRTIRSIRAKNFRFPTIFRYFFALKSLFWHQDGQLGLKNEQNVKNNLHFLYLAGEVGKCFLTEKRI